MVSKSKIILNSAILKHNFLKLVMIPGCLLYYYTMTIKIVKLYWILAFTYMCVNFNIYLFIYIYSFKRASRASNT